MRFFPPRLSMMLLIRQYHLQLVCHLSVTEFWQTLLSNRNQIWKIQPRNKECVTVEEWRGIANTVPFRSVDCCFIFPSFIIYYLCFSSYTHYLFIYPSIHCLFPVLFIIYCFFSKVVSYSLFFFFNNCFFFLSFFFILFCRYLLWTWTPAYFTDRTFWWTIHYSESHQFRNSLLIGFILDLSINYRPFVSFWKKVITCRFLSYLFIIYFFNLNFTFSPLKRTLISDSG